MREIQAADRGGGQHGEIFGQLNAGRSFGVEQPEQSDFFGVVGRSGIAGRGANAAITLAKQIRGRQIFRESEAPGVAESACASTRQRLRPGGRPGPWP